MVKAIAKWICKMKIPKCSYCSGEHYSINCFNKPRRPIRKASKKYVFKKQQTDRLWYELNPPDEKGRWFCYLGISPECKVVLTRSTITLEHVKSKARHPDLRFEVTNLRPACAPCNALKGSLDWDDEKMCLT